MLETFGNALGSPFAQQGLHQQMMNSQFALANAQAAQMYLAHLGATSPAQDDSNNATLLLLED